MDAYSLKPTHPNIQLTTNFSLSKLDGNKPNAEIIDPQFKTTVEKKSGDVTSFLAHNAKKIAAFLSIVSIVCAFAFGGLLAGFSISLVVSVCWSWSIYFSYFNDDSSQKETLSPDLHHYNNIFGFDDFNNGFSYVR